MIIITPRQAELLSYLQGRGTVGEYLSINRAEIMQDLELGHKSALTHLLRHLREAGAIENAGGNLIRVLHRLESDCVVIRQDCERPKKRRIRNRKKTNIIRPAGWVQNCASW